MPNEAQPPGRRPGEPQDRVLPGVLSRVFLVGATIIVLASALTAAMATGDSHLAPEHALQLRRAFSLTAALCGIAVFALCRARWRQVGEGAALWAGTATVVLGLAVAARPELALALSGGNGPDARFLSALSDAGFVVGPLLFAAGLIPTVERWDVSPLVVAGSSFIVAAGLALVFHSAPGLGPALSLSRLSAGHGMATTTAATITVAAWIALAAGYALRGLRRNWLYTWGALTLFALALAGLASSLGDASPDPWAVGGRALEAIGLTLALVACSAELERAYEAQAHRLFDSELDVETAQVRERLSTATTRSRRHDLANAVTAIEGAAMILEREFDRLTVDDRSTLSRVLESGTARLRRQLAEEATLAERVSLSEAAEEAAARPGWEEVVLDVGPELVGTGSAGETTEALRQLMEFAHHRSPGEPLILRGERDGAWVVLRVEDRGTDMSRVQRLAVAGTPPSRSGAAARLDEGLGLRVAARLMRRQGGDLWAESRPGGGASFGICLPAAATDDPRGNGG